MREIDLSKFYVEVPDKFMGAIFEFPTFADADNYIQDIKGLVPLAKHINAIDVFLKLEGPDFTLIW
ncbi:hypothetical protein [Diaphorobacter aerolatus]|uniref:Uncharacterized protein n=1 Tax=Diaphorobacter aerolatus TaxID=1288495 RepID=A0A7H0GJC7_9BURK|nr:hypothetical protein [Diaphorobacter aerolatus]QNP48393.1 hypothetical protein H9K75_20960 [Diaphorobacter aerolatus]